MKRDWVGEWFRLHEERGECVEIWIGCQKSPEALPQVARINHATHDGVSGLMNVLGAAGLLARDILPSIRERSALNPLLAGIGALRLLLRRKPSLAEVPLLKAGDEAKSQNQEDSMEYACLAPAETTQVLASFASRSLRPPTGMLWTLDQAVRDQGRAGPNTLWMLPLTMRGRWSSDTLSGNETSFVDMDISAWDSPEGLQKQFQARFLFHEPALNYELLRIGRWIGTDGMRKILDRKSGGSHRTGVLTAMGRWGSADHRLKDSLVFGAAPTTRFQPFACSWCVWMGKLVITVRVHRGLSGAPGLAKAILQAWKRNLLSLKLPGQTPQGFLSAS